MIAKVFSVFDSKAAFFGRPFFDQKEGTAIRNFSDAVNDSSNPNNMWFKHPEDFSLFLVGEFDDETGELIPVHPKNLLTASAVRTLDKSADLDFHDKNGSKPKKEVQLELSV
jgi:hypothetical protein